MKRALVVLATSIVASGAAVGQGISPPVIPKGLSAFYGAGGFGAAPGSQSVKACDGSGTPCKIVVTVKDKLTKKCEITKIEPLVLVVAPSGSAATITWTLEVAGGATLSDYMFEDEVGLELLGDDPMKPEFGDPVFVSAHTMTVKNERKTVNGYGYNLSVARKRNTGKFVRCAFVDPLIVNRD